MQIRQAELLPSRGLVACHPQSVVRTRPDVRLAGDLTPAQVEVEAAIGSVVSCLRAGLTEVELTGLVSKIRSGEPVDYDCDWKAFTAAYLLVNYRKMLAAARPLSFGATETVVDAGCGVGAASLALLTVLAESERLGPRTIILLDRSAPQLATAHRLVSGVAHLLGVRTEVQVRHVDLASSKMSDSPSIVLMSHVLSEQAPREANRILNLVSGELIERGSLLAVERADNHPWTPTNDAQLSRCEVAEGAFTAWAPTPSSPAEPDRGWNSRWLLATRSVDWMEELVEAYFQAWNEQSDDHLSVIFREDALYHEKPSEPPLMGVSEIEEYWRTHVLLQERPFARVTRIHFGPASAALEWEASFIEAGLSRQICGQMQLDFDPHTRTICALREIFRSSSILTNR